MPEQTDTRTVEAMRAAAQQQGATVRYPDLNAPVAYTDDVLMREMVEGTMERMRTMADTYNRQFLDDVDFPRGYTAYGDGTGRIGYTTAEMPQNIEETERQPGQLERNRHGEPIVEVDLAGTVMTQNILDDVYSRVSAAKMLHPGESIEIRIKRLNVRNMPRLIADTGYIYELLVKMIDEREEAAQRGNN